MKYCYIIDGVRREGPMDLPDNWNEVYNLHKMSNEELLKFGWYPYRFIETYKDDGQIIIGSEFTIMNNEIIETQICRDLTDEEIFNNNEKLWSNIRKVRNNLLLKSDYTQLLDSKLSEDERTKWAIYRQELRDIPNTLKEPKDIVFPKDPNGNTDYNDY